jgi:hypothetical protein
MTTTAPVLSPFAESLSCFRRSHTHLSADLQAAALTSWRKAATPGIWEKDEQGQRACWSLLRKEAVHFRLTWNASLKPARYVVALSDYELEEALGNAGSAGTLNHLVSNLYWPECMDPEGKHWHRVQVCAWRTFGAKWDKGERKFK